MNITGQFLSILAIGFAFVIVYEMLIWIFNRLEKRDIPMDEKSNGHFSSKHQEKKIA